MPTPINWQESVDTEPSGYPLQNGTATIVTVTTPNDGHYHKVIVAANKVVTTATEVGGAVSLTVGSAAAVAVFAGGATVGTYEGATPAGTVLNVPPNTAVTLAQSSALTSGGPSVVNASIVVAQ